MKNTKDFRYTAPYFCAVEISIERGFAASDESGFEQPEYGGADNL
jgi:hypothetical protein